MKQNPKKRALLALHSAQMGLQRLKSTIPDLERARTLLSTRRGVIVVTGLGKSGYVGEKLASTLTSMGLRSIFLHPVEAIHGDIGALVTGDVLIALSYSGATKEVVRLVSYAKKHFGVEVVAITKSKDSALGKLADAHIAINVPKEGSPDEMAPMASMTAMMVVGDMLAASLVEDDFERAHFARLHPGGSIGLIVTRVESVMKMGEIPLVTAGSSVTAILKKITEGKLGVAGVLKKNKLVGIITDGDIRRWLLKGGNPKSDTAEKMMTRSPKTISPSASLRDALTLMETYKITTLFVVRGKDRPQGVVHIHDILGENIV